MSLLTSKEKQDTNKVIFAMFVVHSCISLNGLITDRCRTVSQTDTSGH